MGKIIRISLNINFTPNTFGLLWVNLCMSIQYQNLKIEFSNFES